MTSKRSSPARLRLAAAIFAVGTTIAWSSSTTAAPEAAADPSADVDSLEAIIVDGKARFRAGDFKGAYRRFLTVANERPSHPNARFNAALSARKAGLMDEASIQYRQLVKDTPSDLDAVFGLAEVERALGNVEAARGHYTRYLAEEQRAERAELRQRAEEGLAALPSAMAPTPTPTVDRLSTLAIPAPPVVPIPAVVPLPVVAPAPAADMPSPKKDTAPDRFAEGVALSKAGRHLEAATAFVDVVEADSTRFDAALKAALSFRRASQFDDAIKHYTSVIVATDASESQRLDATYGRAETHRMRAGEGDIDAAIEGFSRYVDGEKRPAEARFVTRARERLAALKALALGPTTPPTPPTTPTATSEPAPTIVAATATPFFGDALLREHLAERLQDGVDDARETVRARGAALNPEDHRFAAGADTTTVDGAGTCDAEGQLAAGEVALGNGDPTAAVVAFRRARACDPSRARPLWGLSRAFDALGARQQGKHQAALYVRSSAPDKDLGSDREAWLRSESP